MTANVPATARASTRHIRLTIGGRALSVFGAIRDLADPDVTLHWLGIRKIHRLVSMSNDKCDSIPGSRIEVGQRVRIPGRQVPADARVEVEARIAAGYLTAGAPCPLASGKGRGLE